MFFDKNPSTSLKARQRNPHIITQGHVTNASEYELEQVDGALARSIWESRFNYWVFLPSSGSSGGIVVMWDTRFASTVDCVLGLYRSYLSLRVQGHARLLLFMVLIILELELLFGMSYTTRLACVVLGGA